MEKDNATALAALRVGVGVALVAAPGWAGRIWVGPGADGPGSKVFARTLGARDVALGATALVAIQNGESPTPYLKLGFAADMADAVATLIAARNLTAARRVFMPLIAGAVGAAGYLAVKAAT